MKYSDKQFGGIRQFQGRLSFTEKELTERVELYLNTAPELLYNKADIVSSDKRNSVRRNGYKTSDTSRTFCEIIASVVLKNGLDIKPDNNCTYNKGSRKESIDELSLKLTDMEKKKQYSMSKHSSSISETHLIQCLMCQKKIGDFEAVDYQIPMTNGGCNKIDLLLKSNENFYICEAKTFDSDESLLRCILEIETYYRKLNPRFYAVYGIKENALRKAVLFDENSFAYSQINQKWAIEMCEKFGITILLLSVNEKEYLIQKKER